jgi:hypothetical protein
METEGTLSSAWEQHLASEIAAESPEQAPATIKEDVVSRPQNGAEVILELLRTNGTDCIFASPIATMAPLWEARAGSGRGRGAAGRLLPRAAPRAPPVVEHRR